MPSRLALFVSAALVACAALLLPGCDNAACVFGGDCSGRGGIVEPLPGQSAVVPVNGDWIDGGAPAIEAVFPSGSGADPGTPVVVVFSEAMQPGAPLAAFDLVPSGSGVQIPVTLAPSALIAGGRVLILRPGAALDTGQSYDLVQRDGVDVPDLNGQVLGRPSDGVVGSFSVASAAPATPTVLTTFPPDNAVFQSRTPEIVVVFSREVDEGTVDAGSFVVTVDAGAPAFPASPAPLVIQDLFPINETRVFTWQSLDGQGDPAPLARGGVVELTLSPDPATSGNKIEDLDGDDLPQTVVDFTIAPFGIDDLRIQSMPGDAINVENLVGPGVLDIVATVQDVEAGDTLDVFVFGFVEDPEPMAPPQLVSLARSVPIGTTSMMGVPVDVTVGAAALDLVATTSPLAARFLDGPLALAFRLRRGTSYGPVTLLDVDPLVAGVQGPLLDTIPPVLLGLGASGTNLASLASDLGDLVVIGRASEPVGAAYVSAVGLGANGSDPMNPPAVAGADAFGLFVARPVTVANGIIPPASLPVSFTLTIRDRALNPALVPTTAAYVQHGVATGALGTQVTVEAFDAAALTVVGGARVFTHGDDGTTTRAIASGVTDVTGTVTLDATLMAGEDLIVTVDHDLFDLFTLHGAVTDRLSVPLRLTGQAEGRVSGVLASANSIASTVRRVSDSRFPARLPRLATVSGCAQNGTTGLFECSFGPEFVRPGRVGSQAALVTTAPATEGQYSPFTFLVGFELGLPAAPAAAGATTATAIELPFLMNEVGLDFEETAIDVGVHTLDTSNVPGGAGVPSVTLEALSPGVPGATVVGAGVAFAELAAEAWRVRSAYPGAVDPFVGGGGDQVGRYVDVGAIEADLFLRAEQTAASGDRGFARPRLSSTSGSLVPPAAPALISPTAGGSTSGATFDLVCSDVLVDGSGGPEGLYEARLTASDGRSWTLYRGDPSDADATDVRFRVPDISPTGTPLVNGTIRCTFSAYAWPGLDLTRFLWTDLAREPTRGSISAELTFTQS